MSVSGATQKRIRQWLQLKTVSNADDQRLYALVSLFNARHEALPGSLQARFDRWLRLSIANLQAAGDGIGTSSFALLRSASVGIVGFPWSLSGASMRDLASWLDVSIAALAITEVQYRIAAGDAGNRNTTDSPPVWLQESGVAPYEVTPGVNLVTAGGRSGNQGNDAGYAVSANGDSVPADYQVAAGFWDSERTGTTVTFTFAVTAGVQATVRLFLAEGFFTAAGQRVFSITIDGAAPNANWSNIDLFALYGKGVGVMYEHVYTPASNTITITLTSSVDNASVRGIEVAQGVVLPS